MTNHRKTLLLFDIDGTLVDAGRTGRAAFIDAFETVTGRRDACDHLSFGGMTDRWIMREGLTAIGHEVSESVMERLLETYLLNLETELHVATDFRVLPAVVSLLDRLDLEAHCALGLGTGNVKRGAMTKLARGGLESRFSFGGFGCDEEHRGRLIQRAIERGAALHNVSVDACRVVVIGDTPRDVEAAKWNGVECLAVATGRWDFETLSASDPTRTVHSLDEQGVFEYLVRG